MKHRAEAIKKASGVMFPEEVMSGFFFPCRNYEFLCVFSFRHEYSSLNKQDSIYIWTIRT